MNNRKKEFNALKHELREYESCLRQIDKLNDKYDIAKARAEKITSSWSDAPGSGNGSPDKMAEMAAIMADLDAERIAEAKKLTHKMHAVQAMIDTVDNFKLRLVLGYRYIDLMSWEQIACEMHYTYRRVTQLHGEALTKLLK